MYVCVYQYMYGCMFEFMYVCVYVRMYARTYVRMYVCVCMHGSMYVWMAMQCNVIKSCNVMS